jgi:hypothetical protein
VLTADFAIGKSDRDLFRAEYVEAMPNDIVQDLVAHELAHGLQSARGIRCIREHDHRSAEFVDCDGHCFGGQYDIEVDADRTLSLWGFDPESFDRWALDVGITKVIDVDYYREALMMTWDRMQRTGR